MLYEFLLLMFLLTAAMLFFFFLWIVIPQVFGHIGYKIDEYNQRDDDD
jgi:hypothetical protein